MLPVTVIASHAQHPEAISHGNNEIASLRSQ
jgi:hypothetical protein